MSYGYVAGARLNIKSMKENKSDEDIQYSNLSTSELRVKQTMSESECWPTEMVDIISVNFELLTTNM